jgi:hypothetical protein
VSDKLGESYSDLAQYLRADDADRTAAFVANDLTTGDSIASDEDWESAGKILAEVVKRASPAARRKLSEDLLAALEKPRVERPTATLMTPLLVLLSSGGTDSSAAQASRRASLAMLKVIQADNEAPTEVQADRGRQLYRLASHLPMAESSSLRLLALSLVVPQRNRFVDTELAGWIGELPREDLVGMLKWPICRGVVRRAILEKLAAAGKKASGDVWLFVLENHDGASSDGFESPARRPSIDTEIENLETHIAGSPPVLSVLR